MDLLGLDALQIILLTGLVSGGTELVKRAFDKNWRAVAIIVTAAVVGGIGSQLIGCDLVVGIIAGLATSGYITIAQNVAKGNTSGK